MKNIRVLIDTNVILDWIMVREPNATNAKQIMEQCLFWQMQCAKEAEVEYIITQNLKDFRTSEIEAICEEEFCRMINTI